MQQPPGTFVVPVANDFSFECYSFCSVLQTAVHQFDFTNCWTCKGDREKSQFTEVSLGRLVHKVDQWWTAGTKKTFIEWMVQHQKDDDLPWDRKFIMSHQIETLADQQWYLLIIGGYREA